MFIECIIIMSSRFFDFSLYRRTDELLRPAEKELSGRFHSTENIQLVYRRALSEVGHKVPYADVTTTMDAVFRLAIKTEDLPSVSDMNTRVIHKLSAANERENTNQQRYADRAFAKSNVPTRFLARPSYSDNKEEEDSIGFLRR